jgi:hypothetical protein
MTHSDLCQAFLHITLFWYLEKVMSWQWLHYLQTHLQLFWSFLYSCLQKSVQSHWTRNFFAIIPVQVLGHITVQGNQSSNLTLLLSQSKLRKVTKYQFPQWRRHVWGYSITESKETARNMQFFCGENTEMDLKKMGCGDLVTNYLLWFRIERIAFVNTVGAFELLKSRKTPLLDEELSGSQEGLC